MKKITFILFALIAGTTFAQNAASDEATATVSAEIVNPISIEKSNDMNFGRIIGSTSGGGTVIINADNTRDFSDNPNMEAPSEGVSAAKFNVKAAADYSYNITINSINLTGAGTEMPVNFTSYINSNNTEGVSKGTGEVQELIVGGALTVGSDQTEGEYSGTVTVSVDYQ